MIDVCEYWICFGIFISSGGCQIEHWRSWHRYECIELESEEGEARNVDQHQTHMLDNVRFQILISISHNLFMMFILSHMCKLNSLGQNKVDVKLF